MQISFENAISYIISTNQELKAIKILTQTLEKYVNNIEDENAHLNSCLRAIKKINKGKNVAIDALCEKD